ncbi:MAG: cation transporter [Planctomycetes bacterium]|nr:cation transporter [Planctomycetota bacterium]
MQRSMAMRATVYGMAANFALFALKATATSLSESLTIFSETLNSLSDLVAGAAILLCVRWAYEQPDESHPFGHRRAEPVAGLLTAIFTGILGFEVCRTAVLNLVHGAPPKHIGAYPIIALCVTAILKTTMAGFFRMRARQLRSPAFRATAVDCRNDVLLACQGLIAVILASYRLPVLDTIGALLIGVYILWSGHSVGMENIDYLMGKAPEPDMMEEIRQVAKAVAGVREIGDVRGHYVGTFVHIELTARVDGRLSTSDSHDVAEAVRRAVEAHAMVDRAFIHIEPATRAARVES